ncbi:hypothetical protein JM83_2609 [Gillisia sp. Hel_I_86]|uniref:hypothetical protein n=1 Tax=Gillisia sp. Hel_I_86 TaxID=1249981 RepID=UPI00119AC87F|nr:hypothetical protein [Gillisia sp. Hel_I_86]TVZ27560.1 hypothetical protein JM83_2609 [Gillisia sp. Hel_I_86]
MQKIIEPELIFYQKLGELFYAIAAVDKVVREQEYERLCELVISNWRKPENSKDEFGTNAAYQIEIVFEWFDHEQADAKECYESFKDYFEKHPKLFTKERKQLILKTANAIANEFAGKNKAELMILAKLKLLFEGNQ